MKIQPPTPGRRLGDDDEEEEDDDEDCDKHGGKKKEGGAPDFLGKGLLEQRTIMVNKPVDRDMAAAIMAQLLILDHRDSKAPITMYINCPGGDADSGFGIYDVMRFIEAPITTVCVGLAASAAVIIFVGGQAGRRLAMPNCRFLIHQPSTFSQGQASDLEITANEIIKTRDLYNAILSEATGKADKQILKDAHRDFWLTAQEALDYGLVNRIVSKRSEIQPPAA
ncbi:MAG: ClpP family protease [Planctomycetota bacterium]